MKIIIDKAIPFIQGVFEPYVQGVVYKGGLEIGREDVMDADALVIRTRTHCNEALLSGSKVRLIATATIGTDHIDLGWCRDNGIKVCNAAGCNAGGVANYVFSALYGLAARRGIKLADATLGIVGVGNVGRRVEDFARKLGFNVLRNDPPRAEAEGPDGFSTLDELLAASDIVTMHVPLTAETRGMVGESFFMRMKPGAFFINASRGEVVDESALKSYLDKLGPVILDTWCNEPHPDPELVDLVNIATPHIAGYSYQGKQNGTAAAVRAVADFFGISELSGFFPQSESADKDAVALDLRGKTQGEIASIIQYNYPIFTDDFMFRMHPEDFERLRSEYNFRKEFYLE